MKDVENGDQKVLQNLSTRRMMVLLVAVGVVTTFSAATPTAQAHAATSTTRAHTAPSTSQVYATGVGEVVFTPDRPSNFDAEPPPEIDCFISIVENPTAGRALDGTLEIHTLARTHCTARVAEISAHQDLFFNGLESAWDDFSLWDTPEVETEPFTICLPGVYSTYAEATIYAPPGYFPPVFTIHVLGSNVAVPGFACSPVS